MAGEKLTWAIDGDDVVFPTADIIVAAYNERWGTSLTTDALYDSSNTWGAPFGNEAIRRVSELLREGITDDVPPLPETVEALRYLSSVDELHLVTGRQSFLEPATRRALDKYLPGVFTSLEFTNYIVEKGSQVVTRSKGEVCAQIGAHILIDDHVAHGESVIASGVKEVIVWGDLPWNRNQKLGTGMVRCVALEEVFRERERILRNRK